MQQLNLNQLCEFFHTRDRRMQHRQLRPVRGASWPNRFLLCTNQSSQWPIFSVDTDYGAYIVSYGLLPHIFLLLIAGEVIRARNQENQARIHKEEDRT